MSTAPALHMPSRRARPRSALMYIAPAAAILVLSGFLLVPKQAFSQALAAAVLCVTLPLGAGLFAAINICTGARWWHPLHGVFESAARLITIPAIAVAVVLGLGTTFIYPWMDPDVASTHLIHAKHGWLNLPFFLGRALAVLVLWLWMARTLAKRIEQAFAAPSPHATAAMARAGVVFCLLFGLTISIAWWDWLMSLEPEWFSTMQGVYGFSSAFLGGIALVTIMALTRARRGELELTNGQVHDLGKMLFAFCFFWGYIWFCQFMLIWYANIPEEGGWFIHRLSHGWSAYFVLNGLLTFVVPFVLLMSAKAKKDRQRLLFMAKVVVVGRALDIWLSVAPSIETEPTIPIYGIAALILIAALTTFRTTPPTRGF
jgi:hypothetical protein